MPEKTDTITSRNSPPLRVGLIGVTGYALAYFEELSKLVEEGKVAWGAVTIINRKAAPEQVAFFDSKSIPIYSDYRTMLEEEHGNLDWLCVPTAIEWHTRMTIDALAKGIPVLLEKPIAPTLQDVETIQSAEEASGLVVAIGFQHNYCGTTWEIKQRLLDGEIGEIQRIDGICLWPRARSYYGRNEWSGRIFVGDSWVLDSPLHNAISHVVNLILFFAGPTLESRADPARVMAELYRAKPIENFDTVRTEALLDTGARAAIVLSHSSKGSLDPEIRITGTKGTFVWRFSGPHTFEIDGRVESIHPQSQLQIRKGMFRSVSAYIAGDRSQRICSTGQAKGEVKWVNGAQDAAVVHDVPADFRYQRTDANGEVFDSVHDIDSVAMRAYQNGCWFMDLDVPWAVEPGELDLASYTAFRGLTIPAPNPAAGKVSTSAPSLG